MGLKRRRCWVRDDDGKAWEIPLDAKHARQYVVLVTPIECCYRTVIVERVCEAVP